MFLAEVRCLLFGFGYAVRPGGAHLMLVALEQALRLIGLFHAMAPHRNDIVIGQEKADIRFAGFVFVETLVLFQPIPERRARQRLQKIDRQHRNVRLVDELEQPLARLHRIGVEAENDAGDDLNAVVVDRLHRLEDRHHQILLLVDPFERFGLRRFDADEEGIEGGFAHLRQNLGVARDVERRFAGEIDRVAVAFLPFNEMRQKFCDRRPIGDEIVVDEIDLADDAAGQQFVEFGDDLFGRLDSRDAAIEAGNVAEFAAIRAAARELDRAEQIAIDLRQFIGGDRKLGEIAPHIRLQDDLRSRAARHLFPKLR